MSLESLLKVLFSHKVTIYKNTGCSGAQCHFEELYSGSLYANGITIREGINYDSTGEVTDVIFLGEQADVPDELMYSIVRSILPGGGGCVEVVITR